MFKTTEKKCRLYVPEPVSYTHLDVYKRQVRIYHNAKPGENYCPAGEDFSAGDLLAEAGTPVDSYLLAAVTAAGVRNLTVYKRLKAAAVSYTHLYRREITWNVFNEKANRFANLLVERGIKKGEKVGILLMNCLEWLPIYFGILKTGALAVPLNFRYSADEIKYCVELAEIDILVFGPEFIGRVEEIADEISKGRLLYFVGDGCPGFAEDYNAHTANCSSQSPKIDVNDDDDAAIYFSSGTTGFPKAILHNHESLMHAAKAEQNHHGQTKDDVFVLIPPLYHTGAKIDVYKRQG